MQLIIRTNTLTYTMIQFSIIVGFRNRDAQRVKNSMDSLAAQTVTNFELIFVDYGSDKEVSAEIKPLVESYSFAKYIFNDTRGWFWNRAHALNTGVHFINSEIVVFSDIDIIYEIDFIGKLEKLSLKKQFYTFNCKYLSKKQSAETATITDAGKYVGVCMVSLNILNEIKSFDEFYMIWGVEDDDLYKRLKQYGLKHNISSAKQINIYHQWHSKQNNIFHDYWHIAMVEYFHKNTSIIRNKNGYGKLFDFENRIFPITNSEKFVELSIWNTSGLRFLPFYNQFFSLKSGQIGQFIYYDSTINHRGKLYSFFKKINHLLSQFKHFHYRLVRKEVFDRKKYTSFEEVAQKIFYFIGQNREYIKDYEILVESDRINLKVMKK